VRVTDDRLVRVLAFIADHAAAKDVVVSSQTACDAGVRLVEASGAGLTLMNGAGRSESRYATNETGSLLDDAQFTLGEGPGPDAFRTAMPVLVDELDSGPAHRRWPLFTAAAIDAGAQAIFAFPLRTGAVRLGALVLHRTTLGPLAPDQVADALVLTDVILSLLLDEMTSVRRPLTEEIRLTGAEIHQATGMVSVQLGVTVEEALIRLRAYAFAHDQPIAAVAHEVVARRLRMGPPLEPDPT
jgi:GAF domain